jgi:hypothetical protein
LGRILADSSSRQFAFYDRLIIELCGFSLWQSCRFIKTCFPRQKTCS